MVAARIGRRQRCAPCCRSPSVPFLAVGVFLGVMVYSLAMWNPLRQGSTTAPPAPWSCATPCSTPPPTPSSEPSARSDERLLGGQPGQLEQPGAAPRAGYGLDSSSRPTTCPMSCASTCRGSGASTGSTCVHLPMSHRHRHVVARPARCAQRDGLDFSAPALAAAAQLAAECGATIEYVESELYAAVDALGRRAVRSRLHGHRCAVLAARRRPLGPRWPSAAAARRATLHARRHPHVVGIGGPATGRAVSCSTRTSRPKGFASPRRRATSITWSRWHHPTSCHFNHGLAAVITSLMDAGMQLTAIEEHDTVPWNPLGDAMEDIGGGEYRLRDDRRAPRRHLHAAGHQADDLTPSACQNASGDCVRR